jgi:hypothetical protein
LPRRNSRYMAAELLTHLSSAIGATSMRTATNSYGGDSKAADDAGSINEGQTEEACDLRNQTRTMFALRPCFKATPAIDLPDWRHSASTAALNSSLWLRLVPPLVAPM